MQLNIILFDGVCNLCNFSVQFILKHDSKAFFSFVAQESSFGKELLSTHNLEQCDTIILLSNDKVYTQSDAALAIVKELDRGYKYLYILRFIPKFLRDWLYQFVAKYRYKFFGKREACLLMLPEWKERFLE